LISMAMKIGFMMWIFLIVFIDSTAGKILFLIDICILECETQSKSFADRVNDAREN
jgi:hypothetical protein